MVSFSHFIPHLRLYRGHPNLSKVMGCDELGAQVKALGSTVHVFGHSHLDVDEVYQGTRFLQCALGYPNERWFGELSGPTLVWPPKGVCKGAGAALGADRDSLDGCLVG